ncbi:NEIL3 [Symbiodinium natans]|uniref:NEIL3 protein n=1 Tax=Symbiodinium natans TaxID=878477 RepID=A0A812LS78_9DINO|nr:NEIL3 [Symbiodinium natans]
MSAMDQLDDESYNLHPSSEQTGALHDDVKMVLSFDTNADPQVMRSDNFATAAKKQVSVRLHSDSTVKVVAKKNLRLLTLEDRSTASTDGLRLGQRNLQAMWTLAWWWVVIFIVFRSTQLKVLKAIDRVKADTAALQQRRDGRRSYSYLAVARVLGIMELAKESYREVKELYQSQNGREEEPDLELLGNAALENVEVVAEQYFEVRSWQEYFKDEVNVTKYNVKKHGVAGSESCEACEVGNDVKDLGRGAATVVQSGREQVREWGSRLCCRNLRFKDPKTKSQWTGGLSQEHIATAVHDTVVAPVKRAWHLMVTGFILCVLVPLFALRTYAPLNSVVSNLGLLWLAICTCCPPRGMHGRAGKAALLVLYPLITVFLPLALHYWATHPELSHDVGNMFRRLPEQLSRLPEQLDKLSGPHFLLEAAHCAASSMMRKLLVA